MQKLGSFFSIDTVTETLKAYDGQVYQQIPYKSQLQEDLVYELQDPDFADIIFKSYEQHMVPTLKADEKVVFEKSLIETALVFGSLSHPPTLALTRTLQRNGFSFDDCKPDFRDAMQLFIQQACFVKGTLNTSKPVRRVCILHTTASGGNTAVTRAIAGFLQSKNIACDILDVEEFAEKHDSMKKAVGYTFDGLYAEIFQKQNATESHNGFPIFLTERVGLNHKITKYIAPCTLQKVKERIRLLAPDLIISTRSYTNEDINLAYSLNIPMKFVICDYDLFIQFGVAGKTDPTLFTFWLPRLTTRAFQYLLKGEYSPDDTWQATAQKIAKLTNSSFEEIDASFKEIGYPVGPEYVRISNAAELSQLRAKWDVRAEEHLVIVTMGKNGVGVMQELFAMLKHSPNVKIPIKYLFICGANNELYKNLEGQEDLVKTPLSRFSITGQISHQEMSEVMNICSLKLSKPGGGASAQCRAMGVPMFVMHAHSLWESGNQRELESANLLFCYDPKLPLGPQIEEAIQKKQPQFFPPDDWKAKIEALL